MVSLRLGLCSLSATLLSKKNTDASYLYKKWITIKYYCDTFTNKFCVDFCSPSYQIYV